MGATLDRNKRIEITFTAEQWQTIMQVLGNGPYNTVASLLGHIQQVCLEHAEALPDMVPSRAPGGAQARNGEMKP